jgi:hypothetical protein
MENLMDPILGIAILVNIAKPALGVKLRAGSPGSDSVIRGCAIALGIAGELCAGALARTLTQAALNATLSRGFVHGALAILVYHLVASRGPENALEDHATGAAGAPAATVAPPQAGA